MRTLGTVLLCRLADLRGVLNLLLPEVRCADDGLGGRAGVALSCTGLGGFISGSCGFGGRGSSLKAESGPVAPPSGAPSLEPVVVRGFLRGSVLIPSVK